MSNVYEINGTDTTVAVTSNRTMFVIAIVVDGKLLTSWAETKTALREMGVTIVDETDTEFTLDEFIAIVEGYLPETRHLWYEDKPWRVAGPVGKFGATWLDDEGYIVQALPSWSYPN